MAQISMAWVMAKPGVSAPIVGTTNLANLEDIIGAYARCRAWIEYYGR